MVRIQIFFNSTYPFIKTYNNLIFQLLDDLNTNHQYDGGNLLLKGSHYEEENYFNTTDNNKMEENIEISKSFYLLN